MEEQFRDAERNSGPLPRGGSGRMVRALFLAALSLGSMGVGYLLRGTRQKAGEEHQSYEIRHGTGGLTNPLLDCEVSEYRPGRELRPFKREVEELVDRLIAGHAAERVSLYFRDLDNGPWFGIREEEKFTGASLLKVPTIMAALVQAEEHPGFLARMVRFVGYPQENTPGQYIPDVRLELGKVYSVDELLRRTAAYSDNAAVGVLNGVIAPEYQDRVYRELDVTQPPLGEPGARSITPLRYGHLFRVLYNASYLSRSLSERALGYFAESTFKVGLEAGVAPGTVVAHKFGVYAIPGNTPPVQLHDCGIVYHPGRPYFLCVMTAGNDLDDLADVIRQISQTVFLAVDAQPGPQR